jgi:hypothetical protein
MSKDRVSDFAKALQVSTVDRRQRQIMTCQEVGILKVKTGQKGTKPVNPSESVRIGVT